MKLLSLLTFSALISITACSHHSKSCCSHKDQAKVACMKDGKCTDNHTCKDGSCAKTDEAKKSCCSTDHCKKS